MDELRRRASAVYWGLRSIIYKFYVLHRTALRARRVSGKGYAAQLYEIVALRLLRGMLDPHEYYYFVLYDDRRYSWSDKKLFIGQRAVERINRLLNSAKWRAIADDKLSTYSILKSADLPSTELFAVYGSGAYSLEAVPFIRDRNSLKDFIRSRIGYPFFAKPIYGAFGLGSFAVRCYDKSTDRVTLFNGEILGLEELIGIVDTYSRSGYLLQEYLIPHPYIRKICGECLSTVRLNLFLTDAGPSLFQCFWKIPTGANMTDNFRDGKTGNLLGSVNLETGVVERAIGGCGFELTEYQAHPTTGERLTGIPLPDWGDMKSLCLKAAILFPGLRLQHWDVALTDSGPVLIELNPFGVFSGHQIVYGKGINDEEFKRRLSLSRN